MGVGAVQLPGENKPAFAAQIDVDQRDIGRISSTRWIASAIVDAVPMIEIPLPRSSSLVATSINTGLSSTITQHNSSSPDAITPVSLTRTVVPIPASYKRLGRLGTLAFSASSHWIA